METNSHKEQMNAFEQKLAAMLTDYIANDDCPEDGILLMPVDGGDNFRIVYIEDTLGDPAALVGFDEIPVLDLVDDEADAEDFILDPVAVRDLALRYFNPQD